MNKTTIIRLMLIAVIIEFLLFAAQTYQMNVYRNLYYSILNK